MKAHSGITFMLAGTVVAGVDVFNGSFPQQSRRLVANGAARNLPFVHLTFAGSKRPHFRPYKGVFMAETLRERHVSSNSIRDRVVK